VEKICHHFPTLTKISPSNIIFLHSTILGIKLGTLAASSEHIWLFENPQIWKVTREENLPWTRVHLSLRDLDDFWWYELDGRKRRNEVREKEKTQKML
jgi:hypothetical protein